MKTVLLLGDSIRLNYAPYVFRKLSDRANICGPEENCRFAKYTLHEVNGWLKQLGTPDIIHWNNGLWDAHHYSDEGPLTPIEDYVKDLRRIAVELKKTGAVILFANCTPVHPQNEQWRNSEIDAYNRAAQDLMAQLGIPVNDLHSVVSGHEHEYICDDLVHLNREGIRAVGEAVVSYLSPLI